VSFGAGGGGGGGGGGAATGAAATEALGEGDGEGGGDGDGLAAAVCAVTGLAPLAGFIEAGPWADSGLLPHANTIQTSADATAPNLSFCCKSLLNRTPTCQGANRSSLHHYALARPGMCWA
jgi:hypothetical protein